MLGDKKYIVLAKTVVTLTENAMGLYEDAAGCVWALRDDSQTLDAVERCGIAPFALPSWGMFQQLNEMCKAHDFAYSCPAYQAFHTREDADQYLGTLISRGGYPVTGIIFEQIAHQLGGFAWENSKTR